MLVRENQRRGGAVHAWANDTLDGGPTSHFAQTRASPTRALPLTFHLGIEHVFELNHLFLPVACASAAPPACAAGGGGHCLVIGDLLLNLLKCEGRGREGRHDDDHQRGEAGAQQCPRFLHIRLNPKQGIVSWPHF